MKRLISLYLIVGAFFSACSQEGHQEEVITNNSAFHLKAVKTDKEYKAELSPLVYNIAREKGTEPAFSGKYVDFKGDGYYVCKICGNPLFDSKTKFHSGTGWPSFYDYLNKNSILEVSDKSLGVTRTEVICKRCKSHLGHVFNDGPNPTGLRYCMDSAVLEFVPRDKISKK